MFFSRKKPAPSEVELPGGKATLRRPDPGRAMLDVDILLPERRADLTQQSPEVAMQAFCEADIALARQALPTLVAALLPLLGQKEPTAPVRSGTGSGFGRQYLR